MVDKLSREEIEETRKEIDRLGKKIKKSLKKFKETDFSKMPVPEFKNIREFSSHKS